MKPKSSDARPREELEYVASEFGLDVEDIRFCGRTGRRAGSGRAVALARGVFFHRMWANEVPASVAAAEIGASYRAARHWYAAFEKTEKSASASEKVLAHAHAQAVQSTADVEAGHG